MIQSDLVVAEDSTMTGGRCVQTKQYIFEATGALEVTISCVISAALAVSGDDGGSNLSLVGRETPDGHTWPTTISGLRFASDDTTRPDFTRLTSMGHWRLWKMSFNPREFVDTPTIR